MKRALMAIALFVMAGVTESAKAVGAFPVAATSNAVFVSSLTERPWWNNAWARRAPILVSSTADEMDDNVVVDVIIDFGEEIVPEEVRVVTPWETEVPCVAEKVEKGKIRLFFKTTLRPWQNKPFLVYWGNPDAGRAKVPTDVVLDSDESTFRVRNGVVDVVFDRRHVTDGLIRSLRLLGSHTVLFDRATGYAKAGFVFMPNAGNGWDNGTLIVDNALAKSVRFDCADAMVTFTLYAEQPRVDWSYVLKRGEQAAIRMNWAPGGGMANDDFYYCGKTGRILTQRAALDFVTDCMTTPSGSFGDWLGEGWYAFGERTMPDIAGLAFDHTAVIKLNYSSYYGLDTMLSLGHKIGKDIQVSGVGAIIATSGTVEDFRRIYRRMVKPVGVSVGASQGRVVKPIRVPRLDRDWCCGYDVGYSFGGDGGSAEPLMKDPQWAKNVMDRLRGYGSTVVSTMGYPWWMMPIKDKGVYNRTLAAQKCGGFESQVERTVSPAWEVIQGRGGELQAFMDAIHAKGMGVHAWVEGVPGWPSNSDGRFMKEINDLAVDYSDIRIRMGQDCAYAFALYGEAVYMQHDLVRKNGTESYWTWKNPQEAFDAFDRQHELMRDFYRQIKTRHPDVPVFLWNSENGEFSREKFASEDEGFYDSMEVEMLPAQGFGHTKHVAKRMRSHFNNRVGHTVWHHYYIMKPKPEERIWQVEWPFIFGVNGYSQENLTYEITSLEMSELTADFFRFAEYTRLGEKVARMAPVKNVGVYRDPKAFREDVLKQRLRKPYPYGAQQDGRVRAFSELPNFNYDVIGPKYFTAKDLASYRVVYVPEDDVISESEAGELLAYIENGGSAIVEGTKIDRIKAVGKASLGSLREGVGSTYGKGKIFWQKEVLTDALAKKDANAMKIVRQTIAALGGLEPYTLTGSSALDGNLQSGPDGLFLGLYNSAKTVQTGRVAIHCPLPHAIASSRLFALDVKGGTRIPLTNNVFSVSVLPGNTGYYLIGDDAFTAVPEMKAAQWCGPAVRCDRAKRRAVRKEDIAGFKPLGIVEFVKTDGNGAPVSFARTAAAKYDILSVTSVNFDVKVCKAALSRAVMLHLVDVNTKESDIVFENCAAELKALLKRGGSIVFSRSPTGTAAQKFLAEIDVFDPNQSAVTGVGDSWAVWCGPSDHSLLTACHTAPAAEPETAQTPEWWNWKKICGSSQYCRVFGSWDASRQKRLFRPKVNGEHYAVLVVQENVLGSGRVVFDENRNAFTNWYEPIWYCENLLSWLTGIKTTDHAHKVTVLNGGEGELWTQRDATK